jgi:hypothetical protein
MAVPFSFVLQPDLDHLRLILCLGFTLSFELLQNDSRNFLFPSQFASHRVWVRELPEVLIEV